MLIDLIQEESSHQIDATESKVGVLLSLIKINKWKLENSEMLKLITN